MLILNRPDKEEPESPPLQPEDQGIKYLNPYHSYAVFRRPSLEVGMGEPVAFGLTEEKAHFLVDKLTINPKECIYIVQIKQIRYRK